MYSRILLVSTYPELTNIAYKVSHELDIPITIYEGGIMKDGHIYSKKVESNFDVIISQGGTAAAIKNIVKIPVVNINIRTTDFLNALVKAKEYDNKIGFVCHKSDELENIQEIKDILNIDFELFPYTNKTELKKQIQNVTHSKRLTVVAMGSCMVDFLKKNESDYVLIKSTEQAIKQAIISAKNLCDVGRKEKERAERLRTIINYSTEGIISLDENFTVTTYNKVAEKILHIPNEKVIGKKITYLSKEYHHFNVIYEEGNHEIGKLVRIGEIQLIVNRIPINIEGENLGFIITIQEVTRLQKLEKKIRKELHTKGFVAKHKFTDIIGKSKTITDTIQTAMKFGTTSSTILIEGETGSGKELFAQSIHNISSRRKGPFVAINCAALPESLLESELFGYEGGAFTGARKGGKQGLFELAHGGTIFLDEIGEIPISLQTRLLRVLQEKEVMKIGSGYVLNVDVRVIAATNLRLYDMVKKNKIRKDLYFRLSVLNIKLPSLRERKEDIPLLVGKFVKNMNKEHHTNIKYIKKDGLDLLKKYSWPGNIRELQNFIAKVCYLSPNPVVDKIFIKQLLLSHTCDIDSKFKAEINDDETIIIKKDTLKNMENEIIKAMLNTEYDDKSVLAKKLGISRTTLWKKLKEIR